MKKTLILTLALLMLASTCLGCAKQGAGGSGRGGSGVDPYSGIPYAKDTELDYLYADEITSWNYLVTSLYTNHLCTSNCVDTLVENDAYGNIIPCIAESWDCSEDGLTWTFHLKKGIMWYTCEGEEYAEVTAHDFVYAARLITTKAIGSDLADSINKYIKNAVELYNGVLTDYTKLGVEAPDDYTLVYTLIAPCPYFLSLVTYSAYQPVNGAFYESLETDTPRYGVNGQGNDALISNDFGTDYDKILYCGAYLCESWDPQESLTLAKNENYWDADNVHITKIIGRYNAQSSAIAPELFLRGEIDLCKLNTNILDDWMQGENAKFVHPSTLKGDVSYYLFNFNPNFADKVKESAYLAAINNRNFRLSFVHALDKTYSISVQDPYNPGALVLNTMIPDGFTNVNGRDYNTFGKLPELQKGMFDADRAKIYRDIARVELEGAGVKLPIKIPVYINPAKADSNQQWLLVKNQIETLLGTDYIEIELFNGPSVNYLEELRRKRNWGLWMVGWIPDYADPMTYFESYEYGAFYSTLEFIQDEFYQTGYIYTREDYNAGVISDENLIGKPQMKFNALLEKARVETDVEKRYEAFAEAERFVIEEALFIPYMRIFDGYVASNLTVFDRAYALTGNSPHHYKGLHLLERPYSTEDYQKAQAQWLSEKNAQQAE